VFSYETSRRSRERSCDRPSDRGLDRIRAARNPGPDEIAETPEGTQASRPAFGLIDCRLEVSMTKSWVTPTMLAALVLLAGCDAAFERARRLLDVELPGSHPAADSTPLLDQSGSLGPGIQRAAFEIPVEAGATLVVHLHSTDFDPVLEVTPPGAGPLSNDDFGGSRADSELSVSTTVAGSLKVVASSVDPAAAGAFQLRIVPAGQPADGSSLLQPGAPQLGALGPGDATLGDGRWVKRYLVRVDDTPLALTIRATSITIPNALVVDPSGQMMPATETGAYQLSQPGPYRVQMMSPAAGQTAAFEMQLATSTPSDGGVVDRGIRAHHALPPTGTDRPLSLGANVTGALRDGQQLPTGEPADVYRLDVPADLPSINIFMSASSLDAYLVLIAPDGAVLEDDDGGGGTDASISFTPTLAGSYRVIATAYRADMRGSYELKVARATRAAGAVGDAPSAAAGPQTLAGRLESGDAQLQSGEFADTYPMSLVAGQTLHLRARSSDLDTYLIVRPPSGAQADNDDGPNGTDAELDFTAQVTGEHQVQVTSYRAGETGAYTVEVTGAAAAGAATPAAGPNPVAEQPEASSSGQSVRGELSSGDATLRSGEFEDVVERSFTVGQPVSLRLTSSDFDPYLIVTTPSGQQLDNDDLRNDSRDAGIDIASAERGSYRIVVTSYRAGETGHYELSLGADAAPITAPVAGGQPTAGGVRANAGGGPRVFGVFAGISDYPGGTNDLPECANDARKLAETLEHQGIVTPERRVLLTDGQATRSAIQGALRRASRELGPDDVLVFFWSGHGNRTRGSHDPREIDGMDESIVLYDGELLDDELGQLFDALHSRVAIVALDSCYSGGFAKDVVTRPGVVGLFSSEEDVLSSVAGQFQAGGYLSYFLREGMGGAADLAPRDGTLTLGELTHYMHQQFALHAADVRLAGAYQELVVDRGAVGVDEPLWRSPR